MAVAGARAARVAVLYLAALGGCEGTPEVDAAKEGPVVWQLATLSRTVCAIAGPDRAVACAGEAAQGVPEPNVGFLDVVVGIGAV